MSLKTDKLLVSVYARHGDTCSCAPHCETLGCVAFSLRGTRSDDYELSAKFAYFQEALDYATQISARGVNARVVSRIGVEPYITDYPKQPAPIVKGSDEWFELRNAADDARDTEGTVRP